MLFPLPVSLVSFVVDAMHLSGRRILAKFLRYLPQYLSDIILTTSRAVAPLSGSQDASRRAWRQLFRRYSPALLLPLLSPHAAVVMERNTLLADFVAKLFSFSAVLPRNTEYGRVAHGGRAVLRRNEAELARGGADVRSRCAPITVDGRSCRISILGNPMSTGGTYLLAVTRNAV
ncbi:hypothetical protein C8J57DRAFT_1534227 [Mycena rebaudengoi]|nr:hypothetical protein C8J57DRAFT_1534227 [Mycena rebaudengoi]